LTEEPDIVSEPGAAAPEASTTAKKPKRSLLRRIGVGIGIAVAALVVLLLVAVVGGRMYLTTDAGRGEVVKALTDLKLSRYGRLKVEGLSGDLLDDFKVAHLTVSDAKGVWLEANNLHVDWNFSTLFGRRFHANEISADTIRVLRRPEIEPPDGKPPQPAAISIDIDRFAANVVLFVLLS
jgi:translocation and assembly module TamB